MLGFLQRGADGGDAKAKQVHFRAQRDLRLHSSFELAYSEALHAASYCDANLRLNICFPCMLSRDKQQRTKRTSSISHIFTNSHSNPYYLESQVDFESRSVTPTTHMVAPVILINLLSPPDPLRKRFGAVIAAELGTHELPLLSRE